MEMLGILSLVKITAFIVIVHKMAEIIYKACVCVCMLAWAQMYLNDGMIKWSSEVQEVISGSSFLCALFYFRVSYINVCPLFL